MCDALILKGRSKSGRSDARYCSEGCVVERTGKYSANSISGLAQ